MSKKQLTVEEKRLDLDLTIIGIFYILSFWDICIICKTN